MNRPSSRAFTLVELLVVIAIIGILVSLLLPAIQATRESARRAQCTNQIRQLILAVHDYNMAHESYPMGTNNPQGPVQNLPTGEHISWIARILPYIEEQLVYEHIDFSKSAYSAQNDRARQTTISILICPSFSGNEEPISNYAGCHNDVEAPINTDNNGVLFLNSQITRDDLKDGAAYTLFLGEKLVDDSDLGWLSGTPSTLRNTGTPINANQNNSFRANLPWVFSYAGYDQQVQEAAAMQAEGSADSSETSEATPPTSDAVAADSTPEATAPPADAPTEEAPAEEVVAGDATEGAEMGTESNELEYMYGGLELPKPDAKGYLPHSKLGGNPTDPLKVGGFSSDHIGGLNMAFGDGTVRFITDDISDSLLRRLANRHDGQIVDGGEL